MGSTFFTGAWTHIHARFNYQLMLPDDYVSAAHRALDVKRDVVVPHYSGARVKPWELSRDEPLDVLGVRRLLHDDSVRDLFLPVSAQPSAGARFGPDGNPVPPHVRDMDGVQ